MVTRNYRTAMPSSVDSNADWQDDESKTAAVQQAMLNVGKERHIHIHLGHSGTHRNGVDGDWGRMSETAWQSMSPDAQKEILAQAGVTVPVAAPAQSAVSRSTALRDMKSAVATSPIVHQPSTAAANGSIDWSNPNWTNNSTVVASMQDSMMKISNEQHLGFKIGVTGRYDEMTRAGLNSLTANELQRVHMEAERALASTATNTNSAQQQQQATTATLHGLQSSHDAVQGENPTIDTTPLTKMRAAIDRVTHCYRDTGLPKPASVFGGHCAGAATDILNAALKPAGQPLVGVADAEHMPANLQRANFQPFTPGRGEEFKTGDVASTAPSPGYPHGHVAVYDGKTHAWKSDADQSSVNVYGPNDKITYFRNPKLAQMADAEHLQRATVVAQATTTSTGASTHHRGSGGHHHYHAPV